jgi:hypothetical protein
LESVQNGRDYRVLIHAKIPPNACRFIKVRWQKNALSDTYERTLCEKSARAGNFSKLTLQ